MERLHQLTKGKTTQELWTLFFDENGERKNDEKGKETGGQTLLDHEQLVSKYFPVNEKQTKQPVRKRAKNQYQLGLEKEYQKAVKDWCKKWRVLPEDGFTFTLTIKPELNWIKGDKFGSKTKTNQRDAIEKITLGFIKACNQFLWKKPSKNKNKFIEYAYVIETKDRHGNDTDIHSHAILCINPKIAPFFNDELIEDVLKKTRFSWNNHRYKLADCIHNTIQNPCVSFECIEEDDTKLTGNNGWIEYILKNAPNNKSGSDPEDGVWSSSNKLIV